jgi:hypothetical protein
LIECSSCFADSDDSDEEEDTECWIAESTDAARESADCELELRETNDTMLRAKDCSWDEREAEWADWDKTDRIWEAKWDADPDADPEEEEDEDSEGPEKAWLEAMTDKTPWMTGFDEELAAAVRTWLINWELSPRELWEEEEEEEELPLKVPATMRDTKEAADSLLDSPICVVEGDERWEFWDSTLDISWATEDSWWEACSWWPLSECWEDSWWPLSECLEDSWWPLSECLEDSWWPLSECREDSWWPLSCLEDSWWSLSCLDDSWWPLSECLERCERAALTECSSCFKEDSDEDPEPWLALTECWIAESTEEAKELADCVVELEESAETMLRATERSWDEIGPELADLPKADRIWEANWAPEPGAEPEEEEEEPEWPVENAWLDAIADSTFWMTGFDEELEAAVKTWLISWELSLTWGDRDEDEWEWGPADELLNVLATIRDTSEEAEDSAGAAPWVDRDRCADWDKMLEINLATEEEPSGAAVDEWEEEEPESTRDNKFKPEDSEWWLDSDKMWESSRAALEDSEEACENNGETEEAKGDEAAEEEPNTWDKRRTASDDSVRWWRPDRRREISCWEDSARECDPEWWCEPECEEEDDVWISWDSRWAAPEAEAEDSDEWEWLDTAERILDTRVCASDEEEWVEAETISDSKRDADSETELECEEAREANFDNNSEPTCEEPNTDCISRMDSEEEDRESKILLSRESARSDSKLEEAECKESEIAERASCSFESISSSDSSCQKSSRSEVSFWDSSDTMEWMTLTASRSASDMSCLLTRLEPKMRSAFFVSSSFSDSSMVPISSRSGNSPPWAPWAPWETTDETELPE